VKRFLLIAFSLAALSACGGSADAHVNPCHIRHECPSDTHSYSWTSSDRRSLSCTSHPSDRRKSDTITVSFDGRTYWCTLTTTAPAAQDEEIGDGTIDVGETILFAKRTKTSGCKRGAVPDRACSPGGFYTKLTKEVLCAPDFRTSMIRDVSGSVKAKVYREYGLAPTGHGRSYEVDHIVPLTLGGSNQIGNLFPEAASAQPGYHRKDALEARLGRMICDGEISLDEARRGIATDWIALYKRVYHRAP
jgi:hypothetical protein